jgi:hypothetical protein
MPIKKLKRKARVIKLKQKQKQSQHVIINLGDLLKRKPRAKPLVPPKPKKTSELILTRTIFQQVSPPYQHQAPAPVTVTHKGLEPPKYIPETYNPNPVVNSIDKMGAQPLPFQKPFIDKLGHKIYDFTDDATDDGDDGTNEELQQLQEAVRTANVPIRVIPRTRRTAEEMAIFRKEESERKHERAELKMMKKEDK